MIFSCSSNEKYYDSTSKGQGTHSTEEEDEDSVEEFHPNQHALLQEGKQP
jgi:hypothetical protein